GSDGVESVYEQAMLSKWVDAAGVVLGCVFRFFFFFQAEDGIRDSSVTGVQTCALPIFLDMLAAERGAGTNTLSAYARDLADFARSEEHTSELQSHLNLVCRLLLEKKKKKENNTHHLTQKQKHRYYSVHAHSHEKSRTTY